MFLEAVLEWWLLVFVVSYLVLAPQYVMFRDIIEGCKCQQIGGLRNDLGQTYGQSVQKVFIGCSQLLIFPGRESVKKHFLSLVGIWTFIVAVALGEYTSVQIEAEERAADPVHLFSP